MKNTIHIGPGTTISLESLLESRLLIQGNSGSGKSALARKMIEEVYGHVPFVVWDVEGEYYTLKELSSDIVIIGGEYGDIPLTDDMAELLPSFIIKNRVSVIVDISDMKISHRIRFTTSFFESLMEIPLRDCTPYLFFLEECHTLAGEQEKQDSTSAIKELMSRGRKRMFCGIPITQRIAMLNKSVAAQCNNKFIGKTTLDVDIERSRKELGFKKASDGNDLKALTRGHFFAYGSSIDPQHVHEIVVDKPKTTMVKAGMEIEFKPQALTAELLEKLKTISQEQPAPPKYADANEVAYLRIQLRELTAERDALAHNADQYNKQIKELEESEQNWKKAAVARGVLLQSIKDQIIDADFKFDELEQKIERSPIKKYPLPYTPEKNGNMENHQTFLMDDITPPFKFKVYPQINNSALTGGDLKIMATCAQYASGCTRTQLTVLTGYKRSSRNVYIGNLKRLQYITDDGNKIMATKAGIKALGSNYQPLPTGRALRDYWLTTLTGGERGILILAIANHPKDISRDEITKRTEYLRSSRNVFIGKLLSRELITISRTGYIKASDFLF